MKSLLRLGFAAAALGVIFGAAGVSNASGQVLNQILDRMNEHNKSLTSLRANVKMVKVNADLGGVTDETIGKVLYLPQKKGDPYVRIDWVRPQESLAVVKGQYVIYRPRLKQYVTGTTKSVKGSASSNNALAFMNMSRAELNRNFDRRYLGPSTIEGGTETWRIELTPKTASSYTRAEVWVDANGMPVQIMIVEKNNDTTTVLLSGIEKNLSLDASLFNIKIPKDARKVKA
jgi:outer membrane lipoprotein-sorting protein